MSESISCPVSHIMVNENRVRITAGFVFLTSVLFLLVPYWATATFLVLDFFLRGLGKGKYSPLNILSGLVVKSWSIGNKPIDQAPKLFAARLGFFMAVLLLMASLLSLTVAAYVIVAAFLLFSFLESVLGICVGCHVYTLVRKIAPGVPGA